MYLPIWILILAVIVVYSVGHATGHALGRKEAEDEFEPRINQLFTKVRGYRILLIQIKNHARTGKKIPDYTEDDAVAFAETARQHDGFSG